MCRLEYLVFSKRPWGTFRILTIIIIAIGSITARAHDDCENFLKSDRSFFHAEAGAEQESPQSLEGFLTKTVEGSNFQVDRGLSDYLFDFTTDVVRDGISIRYGLEDSLSKLDGNSHILDLGAGLLRFADQYTMEPLKALKEIFRNHYGRNHGETPLEVSLRMHEPAHVTCVTMADLDQEHDVYTGRTWKNFQQHQSNKKLTALVGRYFEKIPSVELVGSHGSFDVVLDNMGVFAYTLNLGLVTEKVASTMKPGGELWLRKNYSASVLASGEKMSLAKFLVKTGLFEPLNFDP